MKKNFRNSITSNLNWILTIAWLLFVVYLWFWSGITKPKDLNSVGDFVAGMFAPVAFFWLVRGYYQQGEELQQNTEALRLQAEELKNSVEQQEALVDATKQELDIIVAQYQQTQANHDKQLQEQRLRDELNAMPVIQVKFQKSINVYELINIGSPVINLKFIADKNNLLIDPSYLEVLQTSSISKEVTVRIIIPLDTSLANSFFSIKFTTIQGITYKQKFQREKLESTYVFIAQNKPEKIDIVDC